jgi:nucleoside-diphosphate-sugar epimerase
MRVLVTGATGFIGSHTVAALRRDGHDVRILVRDPSRVDRALGPLGVTATAVKGDMTDPAAVAAAIRGCDSVIHAAGEIGVESGTGPTTNANVDGARVVISTALDQGLDPVIYTSTITVHLPTDERVITPDSPLSDPLSAYGMSKREAELLVLGRQAEGAPVTSFTIGGVYGPFSPHLNGSFAAILGALEAFMLVPPGGLGVVDVRDLATMLSRAVEPGRGPRHYLAGGPYVTWSEWTKVLGRAAGVDIASQETTVAELIDLGRQCDRLRVEGKDSAPLSEEAAIIMTSGVPTDDAATLGDLGCVYRPLDETFSDTVAYLRSTGRLPQLSAP